jgi:hypothetical protein
MIVLWIQRLPPGSLLLSIEAEDDLILLLKFADCQLRATHNLASTSYCHSNFLIVSIGYFLLLTAQHMDPPTLSGKFWARCAFFGGGETFKFVGPSTGALP